MERFKRTIKKIAAFAGGAIMVGATMTGALAALDNLPQPFVTASGVFDSYVVVGTLGWNPNAAFNSEAVTGLARDIASGIDIGASFAQVATSAASGSAATSTVSEGTTIELSGDMPYYGQDVYTVDSTMTSTDLDILDDGLFKESKGTNSNDVDYTQKIEFPTNTMNLTFSKDSESDNEEVAPHLLVSKSTAMYNYTMKFTTAVTYSNSTTAATVTDDWKNSKLSIQGKSYTISDAAVSGIALDKLTLLSGAMTATQGEYTTQTYTVNGNSYEVEVLIISDDDDEVQFRVNGDTTDVLAEGDVFELADGVELGVDFVTPNEGSEAAGADQVTFYLGAQKLVLENGDKITMNDKEIEDWDARAFFTSGDNGGASTNKLEKIVIQVTPDDNQYLAAGGELVDPVFGNWKVIYGGEKADFETYTAETGTKDGSFTVLNMDGKEVEIPLVLDETTNEVVLGNDYDFADGTDATVTTLGQGAGIIVGQAMFVGDGDIAVGASSITDVEGLEILATASSGELHLLKIKDIDTTNSEYDIEDITDGVTYENLDYNTSEDVGFMSDFRLNFSSSAAKTVYAHNVWDYATAKTFLTNNGAIISFNINNSTFASGPGFPGVEFAVKDERSSGAGNVTFHFANKGATDDEMQVKGVSYTGGMTDEEKDADYQVGIDSANYGTTVRWDSEDKNDLTIQYPDDRTEHYVYVAPTSAITSAATSGAVSVNYINAATGISRTDADFASSVPTKNVILIGGPTVNELVSDLAAAGETMTSAEWADKVDTAVIELVEDAFGTYDALIIAGYEAKDTALAGKVLASRLTQGNFADELTGMSVEISTAGASTVNEVSFA